VDCKIDREKLCPLPEDLESGAFQIVDQTRPTTFIIMEAKNHGTLKKRVRFEFRLNPGDDFSRMQSKEGLNEILAPYLETDHVEVQRSTVYKFNSLISENWRKKNIFVCGDACHQTSPFTGQGMNMGIRNIANLVTKIGLVLKGHSDDSLLDRYQIECYDTTLDIIKESLFLGKALFNTTLPVNILRNTIHWLRGSGKNPISILDKILPKPMALPDMLASGLNPFNGMKYASSTPPRGSSLSAYQWVRILDEEGLNSYLMWTSPTHYRIICKDSKPNNIESCEKLPDSIKTLAFVLKEGEDSSQIESGSHFLVPDQKIFNKLFGGGVKYVVMAHQYMMIGTYTEGEEDKMFNDFCGRFDLKR
ncbi:MAG: FAD-dependent monooxygenase, partial [Bdellovibrionota bacterium]|nr:FAD-dependent monooxygenase [Bdellovibrionota bacterium]